MAFADHKVNREEREKMRQNLHDIGELETGEIDLIMEISLMQRHSHTPEISTPSPGREFDQQRSRQFVESLYAIANADGHVSAEEVREIEDIAREFGLEGFIP